MISFDKLSENERTAYYNAKNFCNNLINLGQDIDTAVETAYNAFKNFVSDSSSLKGYLESIISAPTSWSPISESPTVVNPSLKDSKWWTDVKDMRVSEHGYWERYSRYLILNKGWDEQDVNQNIDKPTDQLMNYLLDPSKNVEGKCQGLVFGHVQSGKTAHYMGLINKAVDAGYNIIIVLAGIHNDLRRQTQQRIDSDVLGYDTSSEKCKLNETVSSRTGVGLLNPHVTPSLSAVTNSDTSGDFDGKTRHNPPFIIVTKKNKSRLEKVINYLRRHYRDDTDQKPLSPKFKLLLIDDEADQASLNTNPIRDKKTKEVLDADDIDPTSINRKIRELLELFSFRSYVGYTATPFANIFVPQDLEDEELGWDLFPRDFIATIPESNNYIGAKKFFGVDDEEGISEEDITRQMPLCDVIPHYNKKQNPPDYPKLKTALYHFLLTVACRNCRGQKFKPNSMLIHIDRLIVKHKDLEDTVGDLWREICNGIALSDTSIINELTDVWNDLLRTTNIMRQDYPEYMKDVRETPWEEIFQEVKRLTNISPDSDFKSDLIKILVVNGPSDDILNYDDNKNKEYNVIVIGGDKLSRGLTLEGLSVSYFIRNAKMYDTLMQMGRWFGYRPGYVDLCRLYLTEEHLRNFKMVTLATCDMINQFRMLQKEGQRPVDIVLRIASDNKLLISSNGKLQTGIVERGDYSNSANQTRIIDITPDACDKNYEAVSTLLNNCGNPLSASEYFERKGRRAGKINHIFWDGVSKEHILKFFDSFKTANTARIVNSQVLSRFIRDSTNNSPYISNWTICLYSYSGDDEDEICQIEGLPVVKCMHVKEPSKNYKDVMKHTFDLHILMRPNDEYLDFTKGEIDKKKYWQAEYDRHEQDIFENEKEFIRRNVRDSSNGLLILYPIASRNIKSGSSELKTPFGFAVVFPPKENEKKSSFTEYRITETLNKK